MKQKLLNLCLLAVMMIVGSSGAWGTETSLSPSLLITVNSSGTVVSTGDSWAINQTGLSGNNLFKNSGPVALIKFDASTTLSGKSLQAATLTFDITAGAYNSSMNLYSISLTDWTADNATWSTNYGPTAITIATDWSTKNKTTGFSYDVKDLLNNDEDKVIAFALGTNTAREQTLKNVKLNLTYADASTTASFTIKYVCGSTVIASERTEVGSIGETAFITDADKNAIYDNNKKYIYVSDDAEGKTVAANGSTVVTVSFREADTFTASLNFTSGNIDLGSVSGSGFEGDIVKLYYKKVINKDGSLYQTNGSTFKKEYTAAANENIEYSQSGYSYFFEETDFTLSRSFAATTEKDFFSNGYGGRLYANSYGYTPELKTGYYKVEVAGAINTQTPTMTYGYRLNGQNVVLGESESFNNGSYALTRTIENVFLPEGASFCWINNTQWNSNLYVDYVALTRTGEAPLNKGEWVANTAASATQSAIGDSITLTMTDATIVEDGGTKYLYFAEGGTLKLTSVKDGYGFEKIVLNATKLAGATPVWTGNEKEVTFTFTGETKINSIVIGKDGKLAELPTAATIAEFKATTEETLLTLTGAEVLEKGDDYTIIQDATGGLKLDGIVLDAPKGQKLAGTIAGIYAGNAELVNGTQTDYASPKANGSAQTPTEMTAEEAKTADNIYRLVTLKGVTIRNNGSTITATDKTGSITVDAGTLMLADGDVLASLTGVTYADGLLKATASQSGLLWKADDLAAGQALPVSLTAATYVGKLADVAMGDAITIETLGAGTIEVQNAAGQSIVKYVLTQAENTLHFPVTADMVSDIQKHGLQLVGEGVNAVMAYKLPGLYAANMNENTIWYSDDNFAVGDLITLGAIHFPDVREGDKLENKELTEAEAAFQQDSPYNVISFGAVVDFEKLAVRDDKAEAKEGEEFAQGGYQSTNGMVMSFGGLTEGQSYSFKEAYPAVNKFAAVTEGIDQFPVDNNNKAYDPAQGNVPTKGTFYVFNPTKDGIINVTIDLEKDKKLYVTENGEALNDFKGITKVLDNMISFSVEAGMTYHVFATESNLKYYGFTFTPTYPAAMDVANSIYVFKRLGNVKNAKLMLEDAQVTYIKGDNVFVEDASGAIDLFQTLIQFYVGQKLNGYIFGENIKDFPMLLRTNETPNSQFKAEMGTAQSKTITVAEAKKREAMFRFVTLKNLKQAKDKQGFKVLIDEVGDTIYIEDAFNVLYELPNKIKRIEGIIGFNNGVSYIWPTSKEGVVAEDTPATLATGKYYLKNVGSGLFWGAGNDWGTRGSLLKHAEYVTLIAQGNGIYQMETQVSNGGTAYYFEGDYMDNANPMSLSINKTETEGIYTIADPNENLFGYDGTSTVLGKSIAEGDNALWQIFSEDEMKATLNDATADNGVDATFLIIDPNFGRNNRNVDAWTIESSNKNLSGGNNVNNCAEVYMSAFTLSQEVAVPNGKYVLTAQGAVTFHDNREIKEYDGNGYPQITANDKVSDFKEMEADDRLSSMGKMSEQFTAGMYAVEPITVYVTDGKLTIGAKSDRADIWACWDNFELTYYGPASADGVLLQLDFENGDAADYWQKGVGYLVTPEFEGTTGQAASVKNGSDRGDYILTNADFTGIQDYNVDLDFAICKGSKTAFFAIMSESSWMLSDNTYTWNNWGYFWKTTTTSDGQVHNPYLFELTIPSGTTAYVNEQYDAHETGLANVNGGTWEFTEKNWYHLSLKVKAADKTVGYTVTDKATGTQALSGTYTMRDGESIYMKGIYERNNRLNADPGTVLIDNVVIGTGDSPVTAIETVNAETTVRFAEGVYNLRGQKVGDSLQSLPKGLYIVNGKKVSVK